MTTAARGRLIDAMAPVERLLTAQLVEIAPEDPTSGAARFCLQSYFAELDTRFADGFDPDMSIRAEADDRGDRALPLLRLSGGLRLQRRGLRPPLAREGADQSPRRHAEGPE